MPSAESQFIYTLRATRPEMLSNGPTSAESKILQEHAGYLERLSTAGQVLLAGRTQTSDSSTFGVVIISSTTEEVALEIMRGDPAVQGGTMTAKLFPYQIAVVSDAIVSSTAQ